MEKSLRMENQKRKKVTGKKRKKEEKKKEQAQRRKKEYHSVKKGKNFLCESDRYWRGSTLSRFRTRNRRQTKICLT